MTEPHMRMRRIIMRLSDMIKPVSVFFEDSKNYTRPVKPIKASARMPAVTRAIGTPRIP